MTLHRFPIAAVLAVSLSSFASAQAPRMPPTVTGPGPSGGVSAAPAGTAVVSGRVVSANGGNGIRRAQVRLQPLEGRVMVTQADDQGVFTFERVPAGQFTLTATKVGYLDAKYGQRRPGTGSGAPIAVAGGAKIERLSVPMARGSVITGTIVDEAGEPAYGTMVRALRMTMQNGERTPVQAGIVTADDRGVYRIPVLLPGDYVVMATAPNEIDGARVMMEGRAMAFSPAMSTAGDFFTMAAPPPPPPPPGSAAAAATGYAPVYFPGTVSAGAAQLVTLGLGEERSGIDLQLAMVRMGRVTGTVTGDNGPAAGVSVQLTDAIQTLPGLGIRNTITGPDGTFSFTAVTPGQYTVSARSGGMNMRATMTNAPGGEMRVAVFRSAEAAVDPAQRPQWASAEVTVAGDAPATTALTLRPGMTVSGRLVFDGPGQPADLTSIQVQLDGAQSQGNTGQFVRVNSVTGRVDADGQFQIPHVTPGSYTFAVSGAGAWKLRSAETGGRDVLDTLVDVKPGEDLNGVVATLTTRATSLSGTFEDVAGKPTSDYTVIVAAAERRFWTPRSRRIRATRPSSDGKFSFDGLPAGDYRLLAVDDVEDGRWFDPDYLASIIGASLQVTLSEGTKQVQNIRIR
jgi:uncharacterized protein (DUF2141 family)